MNKASLLEIVILAAGKGTRMLSSTPKALQTLAGKPLLQHLVDKTRSLNPLETHIIYGHRGEDVVQAISGNNLNWVEQAQQLGTAHAVLQSLDQLQDNTRVLILYADVPLISVNTIRAIIEESKNSDLVLLTAQRNEPKGYGRIIRDSNKNLIDIVEEKDATNSQQQINEINTGIMLVNSDLLKKYIPKIQADNAQKEFYLTDLIAIAVQNHHQVSSFQLKDLDEIQGVNDYQQLAKLERAFQLLQVEELMQEGVQCLDPYRLDIRGKLVTGKDVCLDVNIIFEGDCKLGNGVKIAANCYLKNVVIADNVIIHANTVLENCHIFNTCQIGPFARIRPDTTLQEGVKVGNFVEIKKSTIDKYSKINHLSYIGDTNMGQGVNIGAGTITCNYDGAYKHLTEIGNDVFVGSNSAIVAPVKIDNGATIGAGSVVVKSVDEKQLSLSRAPQKFINGWKRPKK